METITPSGVIRVVVQLALAAGVILSAPFLFWFIIQFPSAIMHHDRADVRTAPQSIFGFVGVVALCVSIGTSRRFAAQRPGFRWVLFSGLGMGLIVAGYLFVRMIVWYGTLGSTSWQMLYLTVGPTVVAVWNLVRLSTGADHRQKAVRHERGIGHLQAFDNHDGRH